MKKTHKQIFGCFGLGLVAAMTAVAIALPSPQASATTSITDTIQVRVVGDTPAITGLTAADSDGESIPQDGVTTKPGVIFTTSYENVETLKYSLDYTYTNPDGTETTITYPEIFSDYDANYYAGSVDNGLDLDDYMFNIDGITHGYGHYVLNVTGIGYGGVSDEAPFEFSYAPFDASAEQNPTTGAIDVNISGTDTDNTSKIEIYADGEKIGELDGDGTIHYIPEDTTTNRDIHIEIIAKDSDGNIIYREVIIVRFDPTKVPDTGAPDTGGLFKSLNISREDYLVTGLMVFFIVGIVGLGIIIRSHKSSKKR